MSGGEISYVVLGGCADGSGGTRVSHDRCALSPEFCPSGDDFVSADQLVVGVNHPTCDGVPSATVGRCGDTKLCSATAAGCKNPNTFKQDSSCSVLQDKTTLPTIQALFNDNGGNAPLTLYTACSGAGLNGDVTLDNGGNFCVMTPQECRDMSPEAQVETHSTMCDCSTTRTGACFESGTFEYFCAISEQSCNPTTQNFVTAAALADVGEVDCRLCSGGTVAGLKASSGGSKQFSTGQIVGITIGACFAFMVVAWLTCFTCRKCCCKSKSKSNVPKTVATSGEEGGDVEEDGTGAGGPRVSAHDAEML
mmetsp:Transcript_50923/g.122772  ORF Transcript_50923/g.122772 Transcript_50923/m.122772 type:complete len:308 (-) Transcript_50923:277-1200(-)|eukprot:CAMPEP_0113461870 /NCGR_PEP_ID=MMETSP0014_2-20120614/11774_1 /TAXON_ID=2857 /ORGANISM="Nitzschia sp." /LENGTH=307 /DNA_ID=CAMNT_0000353665 /DNA_START=266 /DNA_END=1189 /DNA_ORIENTATION=- /assembly_acc=CAM_ASM_000159